MSIKWKSLLLLTIFASSSILLSATGFAQAIWLDRTERSAVAMEFIKPSFEGGDALTFATAAWFLSARLVSSDAITLVGEVPLMHQGYDAPFDDLGKTGFGNPYLGMEIGREGSTAFGELGVRIPAVDEDVVLLGVLTEFVDRTEAFVDEAFPIVAALNVVGKKPNGGILRFRPGLSVWIPTGDREDTELFLLYSLQGGYESEAFGFLVGLSGRWFLTSEGADFGQSTYHQFGLAASYGIGRVRPGVSLKLPVDQDLGDVVDYMFGLSVSAGIGSVR